jgi:hypothetical protein
MGAPVVFQHTPRAVTVEEPSSVTLPPELAVVPDMAEIAAVVTVGGPGMTMFLDAVLE